MHPLSLISAFLFMSLPATIRKRIRQFIGYGFCIWLVFCIVSGFARIIWLDFL